MKNLNISPTPNVIAAHDLGLRIAETINTVAAQQISVSGNRLDTSLHQNFARAIESARLKGDSTPSARRLLGTLLSGVNTILIPEVDQFLDTPLTEVVAGSQSLDLTARIGARFRVPELGRSGLKEDVVTHSIMLAVNVIVISSLFAPRGQRIVDGASAIYKCLGHDATEIYRGDQTSLGIPPAVAALRKREAEEDLQTFIDEFTPGIDDCTFPFPRYTLEYESDGSVDDAIIKVYDKPLPSMSHHFDGGAVLHNHYKYVRPEQYIAGFANTDNKLAKPQYQSLSFWIACLLETRAKAISEVYKTNIDDARSAVHAAAHRNGLIDA